MSRTQLAFNSGDLAVQEIIASRPNRDSATRVVSQGVKEVVTDKEDPYRFPKSREVGCFLGLRPGRRNSGESEPQKKISKEGDRYLRTMMVQGAHYILGPFGEDSDLRRWGLKIAERGGKNAKKRAVVAVARKLAVLLHRLWVSGEVYEPLRNSQKAMRAVA
jgi:transposase